MKCFVFSVQVRNVKCSVRLSFVRFIFGAIRETQGRIIGTVQYKLLALATVYYTYCMVCFCSFGRLLKNISSVPRRLLVYQLVRIG